MDTFGLRDALRNSIAQRRKLRAEYDYLRTRLAAEGNALAGLVVREDFQALMQRKGSRRSRRRCCATSGRSTTIRKKPNRYNRSVESLRLRGVVPEAKAILKDHHLSRRMESVFTAMKPARQVAVAEAIVRSGDPPDVSFVPLVVRSRPSELVDDTFQDWGMNLKIEWS